MLENLSSVVGGKVIIERQNKYVTWLAGTKSDVNNIIDILKRYPLLTVRKKCQLNFVENCLNYKDIKNFHKNRENMYSKYKELVLELNQKVPSLLDLPDYFCP
uniref:LAGLIDADG endonuclease n=1 Tax=Elmerina hispida TaxID=1245649 RepID=UPI0030026EE5|nr:LAGLIDADG endonuclease [Elmerina hispida]